MFYVIGQIVLSLGETTVTRSAELRLDKTNHLACEQALRGALAAGRETERERPGMLVRGLKSPVPHNLTEFVNKDAVEVEIAIS